MFLSNYISTEYCKYLETEGIPMSSNDFNLRFAGKAQSFDINFQAQKGASPHTVLVNGINYSLKGDNFKIAWLRQKISSLSNNENTTFEDLQLRLREIGVTNLSVTGRMETLARAHFSSSIEIDVKSAKEAYLLATDNPHDSHVAVGILRADGSISELNLGKNEAYGAHRIGSVTKIFTTFLALKLMNDGMINLETSLGDLIDKKLIDERVLHGVFADPEKARQMTLEQLLSHNSGLDYDDKPRIGPEGEDDPNVRLSTLNERFTYQATLDKKYEHKHQPGEGVGLYSNLGFDVAAWMLELVYNADKGYSIPHPFSQIIRDELFTKVFKLSEDTRIAPGFSGNGDVIQAGCGDMVSSISDLLKVAQVLQKGEKHLSSYFGEEWQKKMLGARSSDGTSTYGLGCEANASSIQFSGLNYELFDDGVGRDVTAHVAFPLQKNQPAIVAMCDSNALGPEANQVKFRQELRKLAGLPDK